MRYTLLLLLAAAAVLPCGLTGCDTPSSETTLVGTWRTDGSTGMGFTYVFESNGTMKRAATMGDMTNPEPGTWWIVDTGHRPFRAEGRPAALRLPDGRLLWARQVADPAAGETFTNTASVQGVDQNDPNSANDSASVSVTVNPIDLNLTKTVSDATPDEGQTITYTVNLNNNSPGGTAATNVVVKDLLPAGLSYVSHVAEAGIYVPGTGLWTIPTVADGDTLTLTIDPADRVAEENGLGWFWANDSVRGSADPGSTGASVPPPKSARMRNSSIAASMMFPLKVPSADCSQM